MHTKTSNISHSLVLQNATPTLLCLRGIGPLSRRDDGSDELSLGHTRDRQHSCTRVIRCPKKRT